MISEKRPLTLEFFARHLSVAVTLLFILSATGCVTAPQRTVPPIREPVVQQPQAPPPWPPPIAREVPPEPAQPEPSVLPPWPPPEPPKPKIVPASEGQTAVKEVLLKSVKASASQGKLKEYTVRSGDTLTKIAKQHQITLEMLELANDLDTTVINVGQKLKIPAADLRIEIDKSENRLRLFNDKAEIRKYPVATGDQGVTPTGNYSVANRLIQPTWYWKGHVVPPDDPDYPLGTRWLGLSRKGYGIHGTDQPESIGMQVSKGCIRMFNQDVEELFEVVAVGTPVAIVE